MQLKTDNNSFIRFLKDKKFIEWKLFPTEELNSYWEEFRLQNPDEHENIALAEKHFDRIKLSSYKVSQERKLEAMEQLESSLRAYVRKRRVRRFVYTTAACAALLVLSLLYLQKNFLLLQHDDELIITSDYIIGDQLESKDILFISGDKTVSFQENIDVEIKNNETAQVKTEDNEEKEIPIAQHAMNKLIVPYGKQSKVVLSDGTKVWLNSGSVLEFSSVFSSKKREIKLMGEMYIEVAPDKNKPFYVHTSDFKVKVYGTSFNVSSYSGSTPSVVLVKGSVSLQSSNRSELFLSPNEQAVFTEEGINTQKVNVNYFISWKDGYLTFNDTPIKEVLKQIERYYNFSFSYSENLSIQELTCTGKIILSDNLDNVMTAFSLISSTKYIKEGNQINIYKK